MRLVKESLEPGHEAWKLGTVADVAGAGTRRGMPDGPGVLEKAATETRNRARGKAPAGWAVGKFKWEESIRNTGTCGTDYGLHLLFI